MKRLFILFISLIILTCSFGCSNNIENNNSNNEKEITILTWTTNATNENNIITNFFEIFKEDFEKETGIKVNIEVIHTSTVNDYIDKVNIKLYQKDGPEIIFMLPNIAYDNYIESGAAMDVTDEIPNLEFIVDGLKNEKIYYIPIGMGYNPVILNKEILSEMGEEEPDLFWTKEDYFRLKEKWLSKQPRCFTLREYNDVVKGPLYSLNIIDENNKIDINNEHIKNFIKDTRDQIFSGKYILNDYSYENYYKTYVESDIDKWGKAAGFARSIENKVLSRSLTPNAFGTMRISFLIENERVIALPEVINENESFYTWGFIVSKNGKNIDSSLKFINELLSDETQLWIFSNAKLFSSVSKNIKQDIEEIENSNNVNAKAIELRKLILSKIENRDIKPYNYKSGKEQ